MSSTHIRSGTVTYTAWSPCFAFVASA